MSAQALARDWADWMADASVHLALLIVLALVLERLLARWWSPALASAVWGLAVARMLLPPRIPSPFALPHAVAWLSSGPGAVGSTAARSSSAPLLLALWLGGIAALLLHDLLRKQRLARELLGERGLHVPRHVRVLVCRIARELGLRVVPEIVVTSQTHSPAVLGVLRPKVLLPVAGFLEARNATLLEQALYHELAHLRRRDPLRSELLRVLAILYWFHPGAWIVRRRMQQLAELGCDARVARTLGARAPVYHAALLEVAARRLLGQGGLPRGAHGWLGRPALIVERLRALERGPERHPRLVAAAAFLLLAPVLMPGSSREARPADPRERALEVLEAAAAGGRPGCFALRHAAITLTAAPEG